MPLLLSLETSTSVCSVAVHEDDRLLALNEVHIDQSHGSKLAVLIEQIKKTLDLNVKDLQGVCITAGPGSYTGLRIGTSTAKGLCFALGIPLIAIGTLQVMAYQLQQVMNRDESLLCPMLDARRMEVYCLLADVSLRLVSPVEAKVIDEHSFADELRQREVVFFGSGAEKCEKLLKHPNARFVKGIYPSARDLGVMGFKKFQAREFEDLIHFEPLYLKEFMIKKPANG